MTSVNLKSTDTYSTSKLLHIMGGLELRMQQFYLQLSHRFAKPEGIRIFWDSLAQQESVHATIIHTLSNMYRNNPNMFNEMVEMDYLTIAKVEEFIKTSEDKLSNENFDLNSALQEAYDLETLEINEIYDRIIESPKAPFRAVIDHLVESEEAHLNALIEAILKYSTDAGLKEKALILRSSLTTQTAA